VYVCAIILFTTNPIIITSTTSQSLEISLNQKHATITMAAISAVVLFYLLSHIFWWTTGSGGLLVAVHAFLRDASMHQDSDDRVEMSGDLSLEENAAFLNPVEGTAVVESV
jgi:hypothetical protein